MSFRMSVFFADSAMLSAQNAKQIVDETEIVDVLLKGSAPVIAKRGTFIYGLF